MAKKEYPYIKRFGVKYVIGRAFMTSATLS